MLAAPLGLVACSFDDSETNGQAAPARSGDVELVERGSTSVPWVGDGVLHLVNGGSIEVDGAVNTTLVGTLAPAALTDTSGAALAYNSWGRQEPVVRIRDLRSGRESVLDEGAHSPAWSRDGRLAYFKALAPELRDVRRYVGHVVVRRSPRAPPRRWTSSAGRYVVAGWARGRIVVYRVGTGFPDLLALDGARRERLLAQDTALVALSPDGRRAVVSRYGASPPLVRILDLASGRTVAQLASTDLEDVVESGSWAGDLVHASTTGGIAVLRAAGDGLRLEQVLRTGATFRGGLREPQVAASGGRLAAWGEVEPDPRQAVADAVLVECDRFTLRCVRAASLSAAAPPRPVYNPSRP